MHPERVGLYSIERKLGSGGMGTVYLGRRQSDGLLAAIKVLPPALAREPGFVARFNREIEALRQLSNPHVVELYEHGEADGTYFYAMEYVEGETLTTRLRRDRRIPWREVVEIAIQMCGALKAAHDAGIIHRDLKPSNLILSTDGTVKLMDFGVAQLFAAGRLTRTGSVIGTAEYMSPEQAGGGRVSKRSDLYSLGAVLYVMLTGVAPFRGKTAIEVLQQHRYGRFDLPGRYVDDLPAWLEEIVCQLLEKDPDRRPPDAFVLSRRLQEGLRLSTRASEGDTSEGEGTFHPDTPTVTAEPRALGHASDAFRSPGPGTLMRDLVRAELERSHRAGPIARWLDNIWVLLAILALLVAGGVWWFQSRERVEDDSAAAFTGTGIEAEVERFFELARHYRRIGDVNRARRILETVAQLLTDRPESTALRSRVARRLKDLDEDTRTTNETPELLDGVEARVRGLLESGRREQAETLVRRLTELYDGDASAANLLSRVQELVDLSGLERPPVPHPRPR
ncbi:MAG: protein kinase [Planctomycetes bacterium]|nr:protein kinase [Planctomycetota bacterium]